MKTINLIASSGYQESDQGRHYETHCGDLVKCLWWDTQGMVLYAKRLDEEPRALESDEIKHVVNDFARAASMARRAGFDGVEIHGANGYIIDQSLRDGSNQRTDSYGGSIKNRARFLFEVVSAVTEAIGGGHTGLRLSPVSPVNDAHDSDPAPLFRYALEKLNRFSLAYLYMVEGATGGTWDIVPNFDFDALGKVFNGRYMANTGYDFDTAPA